MSTQKNGLFALTFMNQKPLNFELQVQLENIFLLKESTKISNYFTLLPL